MTREEAIRHLEYLSVCSENYVVMAINLRDRQAIDMAIKALEEVEPQWVPVSKRLPEEKGLYLVSVKNDHERRYSKTCQYMGRNHWFARQDVEAWMPLPKEYRGEQDV